MEELQLGGELARQQRGALQRPLRAYGEIRRRQYPLQWHGPPRSRGVSVALPREYGRGPLPVKAFQGGRRQRRLARLDHRAVLRAGGGGEVDEEPGDEIGRAHV